MAKKINYHVVTVTEGGADFEDFSSLSAVISRYDVPDEKLRSIIDLKLGDTMGLDGNSTLYILNGGN